MRHISTFALVVGLGVLCTWFAANTLERYQLGHRPAGQVQQADISLPSDSALIRQF